MLRDKFIVWRRSDGYINASNKYLPQGWTQPSDGERVTFEKLGEFEDWESAAQLIRQERSK